MASIIGLALVTLRFSAGVESGLLRRESFLLDPELEKEAANRKPGSHFGGRAAAALERLDQVVRETPAPAVAVPVSANSTPVTTPAAGAPMPRSTPLATGALPVVSAPPPEPPPRRPI